MLRLFKSQMTRQFLSGTDHGIDSDGRCYLQPGACHDLPENKIIVVSTVAEALMVMRRTCNAEI